MSKNIKTKDGYWGEHSRNPEHRHRVATGEHAQVNDPNALQQGYTRSPMTGVADAYMDDGIRRYPEGYDE